MFCQQARRQTTRDGGAAGTRRRQLGKRQHPREGLVRSQRARVAGAGRRAGRRRGDSDCL